MANVICIHPYDKTTKFLSDISNFLKDSLGTSLTLLEIGTTKKDHDNCLTILNDSFGDLVIFLGHGGSSYLLGASGDYSDSFVSDGFASENPDLVYKHEHFIDGNNASVLQNKRVFCLSCYSGEQLGIISVGTGTDVFLGFGDIPTSEYEFSKMNLKVDSETVEIFKKALNNVIINSLGYAINNNCSFERLNFIIRYFVNVTSRHLILQNPADERTRLIADTFFHFKNGIQINGKAELPFLI